MSNFQEILAVKVNSFCRTGPITIRDYLKKLLKTLWLQQEEFSGKRPFGDSGWTYDLYSPLVQHGFIKGTIEDGYLEEFDQDHADKLIMELIEAL